MKDIKEETNQNSEVKEEKHKKFTAFDMFDVFTRDPLAPSLVNIDGVLHWRFPEMMYYAPLAKDDLESYLIKRFYTPIRENGSIHIVKTCADIIMRTYNMESVVPAERELLLCLKNGYIDLNKLEQPNFSPYSSYNSRPIYPTYLIDANWYPHITWEVAKTQETPWMNYFIQTIANGNPYIVARIWQMIGYLLTPDTNGKCLFMLQGVSNSGKSVLGNFIKSLFPDYRITSLDIDQLGKRTSTSLLVNKSLNLSMDLPNKTLPALAIRNLKLITGNDDVTVEYGNGKYSKYYGNCKFLFATNHPLALKGADPALVERIVCIPFTRSISVKQRNNELLKNLKNEKDCIVIKALSYYRDLRLSNYKFAGSELDICKPKMRYLPTEAEDSDAHLCEFVDTKCKLVGISEGQTFTYDLYNAYLKFCSKHSYTPLNDAGAFSRRLHKCYGEQIMKTKWRDGSKNQNGFKGIVLDLDY